MQKICSGVLDVSSLSALLSCKNDPKTRHRRRSRRPRPSSEAAILSQIVQNDSILSSVVSPRSISRSIRERGKRVGQRLSEDFLYSATTTGIGCDNEINRRRRRRRTSSNLDEYTSRLRCDTIEELVQRHPGLIHWDDFCLVRKSVQDSDVACRGLYNQLFDLIQDDVECSMHAERIQVMLRPFLELNVAECAQIVSYVSEIENGSRLTALCSKLIKAYKLQQICLLLWLSRQIKNRSSASASLSREPDSECRRNKEPPNIRSKSSTRYEEGKFGEAKEEGAEQEHYPFYRQRDLVQKLRNELISTKTGIESLNLEIEKGIQWISLNHNPRTILAKHYSIQFATKKLHRLIFIRESMAAKKLFSRWQTSTVLDAHAHQVAAYFRIKCCHLLENIFISNVVRLYGFSFSNWGKKCTNERNRASVKSCMMLQKFVRGFVSRKKNARKLEIQCRSARMIQMRYRCLLAKDMLNAARLTHHMEFSAVVLQSIYRRKQAVVAVKQRRKQQHAAVVLQCSARSRRSIAILEGKRSQKVAATKLQSKFRGRRVSNEFLHAQNALSVLQRTWRGKLVRCQVAQLRCLQLEQTQALLLQSLWRGRCERRHVSAKMLQLDCACIAIQNCWRQHVVRKRVASVEHFAATCVQRWFSRLRERRMRKAACKILGFMRRFLLAQSMKLGLKRYEDIEHMRAILIIQCAERIRVARLKTRYREDFAAKTFAALREKNSSR